VSMQSLIQERSEAVLSINKSLGELKFLFEDVSSIVVGQQGGVDQLESNVLQANEATEVGLKELEVAMRYQKQSFCVLQ